MNMFGVIANDDPPDSVPHALVATSHTASPSCSPISAGDSRTGSSPISPTGPSSPAVPASSEFDEVISSLSLELLHPLSGIRSRRKENIEIVVLFFTESLINSRIDSAFLYTLLY